ncbi:MAG: hypothetical protein K8F29_03520 [Kofleriaceae bacterium]|nr:hypothetical protein [Candidatus Methylomirabilis lanthanidiphila]
MDQEDTHQPISSPRGSTLWASVGTRLLLLTLMAIVPALGLALYTGLEHRRTAAVQAQQEALRLARIASNDHERLIEGAHQLLVALSLLPAVRTRDARACSAFFADLLKQYTRYANLGVVEADGYFYFGGGSAPGRPKTA